VVPVVMIPLPVLELGLEEVENAEDVNPVLVPPPTVEVELLPDDVERTPVERTVLTVVPLVPDVG